ncbi:flavin monoamine oxidase family protein [Spiroplasma culicicola]|uniref:Monoamine oxidase n=1 Tax=Spiroplasma culicicola AES-1 TaxID=1276246 RepID=W6AH07_9MOLU|nr:NAD(P)/FAD-dependent oxidoreductase [Spiroplasma culicicola]AHI52974.1 monoamine oxidase [Spiroplasma culicicola AES-1]
MKEIQYDVIVIGAGFAGLTVGLELQKLNKTFKIIEARNVVGGRVFNTHSKNNEIIELGGQWLGPLHTNALELVQKHNLNLYETPPKNHDKHLYLFKENQLEHLPNEVLEILQTIEELAEQIDINAPYNHKNANYWDVITLDQWLIKKFGSSQLTKMVGRNIAGNFLSCSSDETSFLQTLFYIASNNSIDFLSKFKNGAQNFRVEGSMAKLAAKLGEEIGINNIYLDEYVKQIINLENSYRVVTSKQTLRAQKIVITCAPRILQKIEFIPELPKEYKDFYSGYTNGKAYKFHFEYNTDFWTKDNKSGYFFKDDGLITEVTDNSMPNSNKAIYTGFIYGKDKDRLYKLADSKGQRGLIIAQELAKIYGSIALKYNEFFEYDWSQQPYQDGCFVSRVDLNKWTKHGKVWQQPYQNIFFAGTETSSQFNGYIEGAIRSGLRVIEQLYKNS